MIIFLYLLQYPQVFLHAVFITRREYLLHNSSEQRFEVSLQLNLAT